MFGTLKSTKSGKDPYLIEAIRPPFEIHEAGKHQTNACTSCREKKVVRILSPRSSNGPCSLLAYSTLTRLPLSAVDDIVLKSICSSSAPERKLAVAAAVPKTQNASISSQDPPKRAEAAKQAQLLPLTTVASQTRGEARMNASGTSLPPRMVKINISLHKISRVSSFGADSTLLLDSIPNQIIPFRWEEIAIFSSRELIMRHKMCLKTERLVFAYLYSAARPMS